MGRPFQGLGASRHRCARCPWMRPFRGLLGYVDPGGVSMCVTPGWARMPMRHRVLPGVSEIIQAGNPGGGCKPSLGVCNPSRVTQEIPLRGIVGGMDGSNPRCGFLLARTRCIASLQVVEYQCVVGSDLQPFQGCCFLFLGDPREGFAHPGVNQEIPLRGIGGGIDGRSRRSLRDFFAKNFYYERVRFKFLCVNL